MKIYLHPQARKIQEETFSATSTKVGKKDAIPSLRGIKFIQVSYIDPKSGIETTMRDPSIFMQCSGDLFAFSGGNDAFTFKQDQVRAIWQDGTVYKIDLPAGFIRAITA